jgi:hypothetical protein
VRLEGPVGYARLAVVEEKELFVGVEILVLFERFALFCNLFYFGIMFQREFDGAEHGVEHPAINGNQTGISQDVEHATELPVSAIDKDRFLNGFQSVKCGSSVHLSGY